MNKPQSITKIKDDLWKLVSASIKKRDNYRCWHCGKVNYSHKNTHCSHILPKGQYPKYEFCSWNLKTLCFRCHMSWWHKNPLEAAAWFSTEFSTQYKKSLDMASSYKSYPAPTPDELLALKLKLEKIML